MDEDLKNEPVKKNLDSPQKTTYGKKKYKDAIYEGELLNGQPHGQGTMTYDDGNIYSGQYK